MRYIRLESSVTTPILLDLYPNAEVAYSLRLLRTDYTGALVKIRRSSDNAVKDFYPDANNELSLTSEDGSGTSLSSWIGATEWGFVRTWYDQSGNGNNLNQTNTSQQPIIITSGVIEVSGGHPSIYFSGVNEVFQRLNLSSLSALTEGELFEVLRNDGVRNNGLHKFDNLTATANHYPFNGVIYDAFGCNTRHNIGTPTAPLTNINVYNPMSKSGEWTARHNNELLFTTATNTPAFANDPYIGATSSPSTNYNSKMWFSEIILYPSEQSANRADIKSNLYSQYSITP